MDINKYNRDKVLEIPKNLSIIKSLQTYYSLLYVFI